MGFLEPLMHPAREYSPIPFWFLNGDLRHAEIRRQLRDFCGHGVYGAVLHPRMGLSKRIGYLSPAFFSYLRTAIEEAKVLGMRIVLYDEGMYPSGSAGGLIVRNHPDRASRGIALTNHPLPGDRVLCETEKGLLVERFSGGTIRGLHYGEDDGEENAPRSADILDPEAVEEFISLTHEAYWREFKEYFGDPIIGFFTDEPSILGRNTRDVQPWTKGFDQVFAGAGGDLSGLSGLFTGEENADTALYRRLIQEREGAVYYSRLSRWCESHGIALMGHPHQSDDIEPQRFFHVPGQDLVFRWVAPETGDTNGMDSVMAKCGADMARLMGRKRNANECFGACSRDGNPWHFTGADMKWFIDYLAVRGVNLFIPHAFYYSLRGKRSAERPPDVGPGSIWWPHYRLFSDYMARLSRLTAEGEAEIGIAVLCKNRALRPEDVKPLFETQRAFQYLPESVWQDCREENGRLVCQGRAYQAVMPLRDEFPSVSRDVNAVPPDCLCEPPQRDLRAAKLRFHERTVWLLVNASQEKPLDASVRFPTGAPLGQYDLWHNEAWRLDAELAGKERRARVRLDPCESLLVFACGSEAEFAALPAKPLPAAVLTNRDFTLENENKALYQKTYSAKVAGCSGPLLISVSAQEMAEVSVENKCLGVSFWTPHKILIPAERLPDGPFTLRLTVTGSKANQYGRPVPYGLESQRFSLPL